MKKNYIAPDVKVTMVALQQMIATSPLDIDPDNSIKPENADAKDILDDWDF